MTPTTPKPSRVGTRRFVAVLMVLPAVVVAFWMIGIEGWRWYRPRSPLYTAPFTYSLAEAIALDERYRAYEFLQAGQDPNQPIPVRHPVLTKGRGVLVSPLVWAVALRRDEIALMLLGFEPNIDAESRRNAVCLAERLGNTGIASQLQDDEVATQPCPVPRSDDAPLLAFLAEPE